MFAPPPRGRITNAFAIALVITLANSKSGFGIAIADAFAISLANAFAIANAYAIPLAIALANAFAIPLAIALAKAFNSRHLVGNADRAFRQ